MFRYLTADTATRYGSAVHYQHGHLIEIIQTIRDMSKAPTQSAKKFPLVALIQDFEEKKGSDYGTLATVSLSVLIAMNTDPKYKAAERYTKTFKTVLYPVYEYLLEAMARSGYFTVTDAKMIDHTKVDRLYWGKNGLSGNSANAFDDYIDAIEIKNLNLIVKRLNTCIT
jgi:hypothetical protein